MTTTKNEVYWIINKKFLSSGVIYLCWGDSTGGRGFLTSEGSSPTPPTPPVVKTLLYVQEITRKTKVFTN